MDCSERGYLAINDSLTQDRRDLGKESFLIVQPSVMYTLEKKHFEPENGDLEVLEDDFPTFRGVIFRFRAVNLTQDSAHIHIRLRWLELRTI